MTATAAAEELESEERQGPTFRDIRRYYCEFCGICRSKKSLIKAHIESHHKEEVKDEEEEVKVNACEECGVVFKKPAHLRQHVLSHSLERPFVCNIGVCQMSYRRKDHLNRHLIQHQGKLFKCSVEGCNKEFCVEGNLKRHFKNMHELKPMCDGVQEKKKFVCQEAGCGKEFLYESKLRKHENSHGKSLAVSFVLAVSASHLFVLVVYVLYRFMTGVVLFFLDSKTCHLFAHRFKYDIFAVTLDSVEVFCIGCNKPFSNRTCLKAHLDSCHQHVTCKVCGCKHLRKNIRRHLRSHEVGSLERIRCVFEDCGRTFSKKSNLQQHIRTVHHKHRRFVCGVDGCGMRFTLKHVRDNHEKTAIHNYVHGDLEELDEQLRSRPRGGCKRKYPSIEMLTRKRVCPPCVPDPVIVNGLGYESWMLSYEDSHQSQD
ncbi:Transcription factor IIIA-like protein [Drosera capensis]